MDLKSLRRRGISLVQFLQNTELFQAVPVETIKDLLRQAEPLKLKPGRIVLKEGESGSDLYVVVIGRRLRSSKKRLFRPVEKDLLQFLERLDLFSSLPATVLRRLEPMMQWMSIPDHEEVLRQGDAGDGLDDASRSRVQPSEMEGRSGSYRDRLQACDGQYGRVEAASSGVKV